ncbi:MAG: hypothetical protein AABY22_19750, partial [Nanoarchaeota archaeon]
KGFSQSLNLYINHPLIDKIHITEFDEKMGDSDIALANSCNLKFDLTPKHKFGEPGTSEASSWWNYKNIFQETFEMSGLDLQEYNSMPPELQKPRLYQWFDINRFDKVIGVWPFSGYSREFGRSPTVNWYNDLFKELIIKGYTIYHFGHFNEPNFDKIQRECGYYRNYTKLPFFNQIIMALGCQCNINCDQGTGIAIGAYGFPQISLLIKNAPLHFQKFDSFGPLNYNDLNINLLGLNGQDSIKIEDVLAAVDQLK